MSEATPEIEEQIARMRRMNAETEKFIAEQRKLMAEADKYGVEQRKLIAEAEKYRRERVTVILTGGAAILAAGAALGGVFVKLFGG